MVLPTPLQLIATSVFICVLDLIFFPDLFPEWKVTKLFAAVGSVVFGLWVVWRVLIYPTWFSPLRHLPSPSGSIPFIGYPTISTYQQAGETFLKFISEVPNDGLIRFTGPMNQEWLVATDPTSLAEILVQKSYDFMKPKSLRDFLRRVLGDGLVIVEGDMHKFQRKNVSPAFTYRHIKELYPIFWQKAKELSDKVIAEVHANLETHDEKSQQPEAVIEVNRWANKVAIDIIGVAGLGRQFNALYNAEDEFVANYEELLEPTYEKVAYFAANLIIPSRLVSMLPWRMNELFDTNTTALRAHCHQFIRDKKASISYEKDILSILIESNNFTDGMLVDQLLTFLAAGHETTSSAFTWALYLLSKKAEMQTRLREEIRTHLPSPLAPSDPLIDIGAIIESLPYLHGVIAEALRLYPPVPTTTRVATHDTTINDTPIPAGTRIWLSLYAINRSPHLWENANEFLPERWMDPDTGKANNTGGRAKSNYSQMTFLHGPRSCIGEKFAKSELKALVALFVGKFAFEMADPNAIAVPGGAVTCRPTGGLKLRLRVLEGW